MKVTDFGRQLQYDSLIGLYKEAELDLTGIAHGGQGTVNPPFYSQTKKGLTIDWSNRCEQRYGSYEELISVVAALRTVTTSFWAIPADYQNRESLFQVYLIEAGWVYVGVGSIQGAPPGGIEVE